MSLTIEEKQLKPSPGDISYITGVSILHKKLAMLAELSPESGWPQEVKSYEQDFLNVTNATRAKYNAQPVQLLGSLSDASGYGCRFLANYHLLVHNYPDEPGHPALTFSDRLAQCGYSGAAGENAAYGLLTAQDVVNAFMSEGPGGGHYENMINKLWNACGLGVARDPITGLLYWVQDFGVMPFAGPSPVVTSMMPSHGKVGSDVSLLGRNFIAPIHVVFIGNGGADNREATIKAVTPQTIVATVPEGAHSGLVGMTAQGGYAIAPGEFTVESGSPPPPTNKEPAEGQTWSNNFTKKHVVIMSIIPWKKTRRVYFKKASGGTGTLIISNFKAQYTYVSG
jgi:uncharacterized protein YkwD